MSKLKSSFSGLLVSLLFLSTFTSQSVRAEDIQGALENQSPVCALAECSKSDSFNTDLEARNSGELIAGFFRLVWRFATRGL